MKPLEEKFKSFRPTIVYTLFSVAFLSFPILLGLFGFSNFLVYVFGFLISGFCILKYPEVGVYTLLVLTLIFERYFTLEPLSFGGVVLKLYPLDVIILMTFFSATLKYILKPRNFHLNLRPLDFWMILYILIFTYFFIRSLTLPAVDFNVAFSAFKNYGFYATLYFLFLLVIRNKKQFRIFAKIFNYTSAFILIFLAIGVLRGEGLWTEFTPLSTEGVRYLAFPHSLFLALSIVFTLPLIFYKKNFRFSNMSLVWLKGIGVVAGLMRHLWISLFVGLCFIFWKIYKESRENFEIVIRKNIGALLMMTSLVLLVLWIYPFWEGSTKVKALSVPFFERFTSASTLSVDSSWMWRTYAWKDGFDAFMSSPFLGIGFGKNLVLRIGDFQQVVFIRELHNSLLVLLVQTGIVGMFFFAAINITTIYYLLEILKRKDSYFHYALGVSGMYILFMVASLWQPYLETNIMGIFYWLILGMTGFMYSQKEATK